MKNQNDLIAIIVSLVLGIGLAVGFFFTKREVIQPAAPTQVVTTPVTVPAPTIHMQNGIVAGNAGGAIGGVGGPGGRGGFAGPSGIPSFGSGGPMAAASSGAGAGAPPSMGGKGGR